VDEDLFEVSGPAQQRARGRLESVDGICDVSHFGQRLHVFCRRGRYTEQTLKQAVQAQVPDIASVAKVPFSLEDAFIRLVQPEADGMTRCGRPDAHRPLL
jgi:hypothetical protein